MELITSLSECPSLRYDLCCPFGMWSFETLKTHLLVSTQQTMEFSTFISRAGKAFIYCHSQRQNPFAIIISFNLFIFRDLDTFDRAAIYCSIKLISLPALEKVL